MKIATIIGARPQFIKAALVSEAIRKEKSLKEVLIHTGQHYDYNMSGSFFSELRINKPRYNLSVGGTSACAQVSVMLEKLEKVLKKESPDIALVYGDTNSTLAGALSAFHLRIPVAHVEAGLRSYDKTMPEETNRVITDEISEILFCPTRESVRNLKKEGISKGVYLVGDIMFELAVKSKAAALKRSRVVQRLGLEPKSYILTTVHRQANTDNKDNLSNIVSALCSINAQIVFPVHPRTRKMLLKFKLMEMLLKCSNIRLCQPLGYLDMVALEINAKKIITDSGGVQKEAYFFKIPCITLRDRTEWVETLKNNWNVLAGTDKRRIMCQALNTRPCGAYLRHYGDARTCARIIKILKRKDH